MAKREGFAPWQVTRIRRTKHQAPRVASGPGPSPQNENGRPLKPEGRPQLAVAATATTGSLGDGSTAAKRIVAGRPELP